jgi:hypothetical protein
MKKSPYFVSADWHQVAHFQSLLKNAYIKQQCISMLCKNNYARSITPG